MTAAKPYHYVHHSCVMATVNITTMRRLWRYIPAAFIGLAVLGVVCWLQIEFAHDPVAEDRARSLHGLAGNVRSNAALAHALWVAAGSDDNSVAFRADQRVEIDLLTGFPSANASGIDEIVVAPPGFTAIVSGDSYIYSIPGVPIQQCHVTYKIGQQAGLPPKISVRSDRNGGKCS